MAKTEGTQTIPALWLDAYRATLSEQRPNLAVHKRVPYRLPNMQKGGANVSAAQRIQRDRFLYVRDKFNALSQAEKERWYAAMPEWSSLLWYYNYYIMSGIMGEAYYKGGGKGVIKSIQFKKEEVPATGTKSFTITAVDPNKTVVMLFGNSYISDKIQRGQTTVNQGSTKGIVLSPEVDVAISEVKLAGDYGRMDLDAGTGTGKWAAPYVVSLAAALLTVGVWDVPLAGALPFSWEVIEHKAQTVFPVIVSIAAEAVVIDWSLVPSVAADVSIIVIEYI